MKETQSLYLDLMKKTLTNWIYGDAEIDILFPRRNPLKRAIAYFLNARGLRMARPKPMNALERSTGSDRSPIAHTMIGLKRLENIQFCIEDVLVRNIAGDFIEAGVWRGGATIFMRAVLRAFDIKDRTVWVADSFEGCPAPDGTKYPDDKDDMHYAQRELAVSLKEVRANFMKYGLLDNQVRFLKGWFKNTLPNAPIDKLAVIRLDGDLYESTMDALCSLYPKLSTGGYVIIDDFGAVPACHKAVLDYRSSRNIDDKIIEIDWTGVYWQRTE